MRALTWAGLACFAVGIGLMAVSLATGEGQVFLVLFIPVFTSSGPIGLLGIIALFAGIFLGMVSFAGPRLPMEAPASPQAPVQAAPPATGPARPWGGVVMLGPIPLVFGSDARIAKWMMVLGIVLTALVVALFLILSLR